jgi:alpha-tubulin suppressor-like RCC1 family protein
MNIPYLPAFAAPVLAAFSRIRRGALFAVFLALVAGFAAHAPDARAAAVNEAHTLDILFVYTDATERKFNGEDGMKARANAEIEYNNKCYDNSLITAKHRLVGIRKVVGYSEANTSFEDDLYALTDKTDGIMDVVHEWRNELAADLVSLMRSTNYNGVAGLAWLMPSIAGNPDTGFSVIGPDVTWSYAHEVGHNLGCGHNREQGGAGIFPYSYGYLLPNGTGTIMSYTPNYIPHFSNPEVQYAGIPTGVPETESNSADCAKTINQTLPVAVTYRRYKPGAETPVITPPGGNFAVEQTATITCATQGAVIRYTLDGTEATETSPIYSAPIELRYSATVSARAFPASGIPSEPASATFNIVYPETAQPVIFTPDSGEYKDSVTVSLTTLTAGATIYYTINGQDVSESSSVYTAPLTIRRDLTVKARAYKYRNNPSIQTEAEYVVVNVPQVDRPTINLSGQLLPEAQGGDGLTYVGPVQVSFTPEKPGDTIRYTTNNFEVSEDSPLYQGAFLITRTTNVRVRAWCPEYKASVERTRLVRIIPVPAAAPVITPNGGEYVGSITVHINTATPGAFLRYTTNGANLPDQISADDQIRGTYPVYNPANPPVFAAPTTLKVRAYHVDYETSPQSSAFFNIRSSEDLRLEYGTHIAAGDAHSLFLNGGVLTATGRNNYGQLGNGNTQTQYTTVTIATNVSVVSSSRDHTLFITRDNKLYGTGRNEYGQLGDGTAANRSLPTLISDNALFAAAGGYHTLFITLDGTLHTVGRNEYGQLGDGTATERRAPVAVAEHVLFAAAGKFHSLYLLGNGELWGMGRNDDGQLGQGTTADYRRPVKIADGVRTVAAGTAHTVFLTFNGEVYAMGTNTSGQLGLDPVSTHLAVRPVHVASGVSDIASGDAHILFLKGGELFGLGANDYGQLGADPATTPFSFAPVKIAAEVDRGNIAAGAAHTVFAARNGTSYSLGSNAYGQLGDGTTSSSSSPNDVAQGAAATAPTISPNGGSFEEKVEVRLTGVEPASSVYYTINGDDVVPGRAGTLTYGAPFTLERPAGIAPNDNAIITLKTRAWNGNKAPSTQTVARFVLLPPVARIAPVITLEPEDKTVVATRPVVLSVSATGSPAPTYQWYLNGNKINGATQSAFSIERAAAANAGNYHVVVTNAAGSVESRKAILTIQYPPVITRQPIGKDIYEGAPIELSVVVNSDTAVTYQWRRDGQPLSQTNTPNLVIANARVSQSGTYDVVVSNVGGALASDQVVVTIRPSNGLPVILRQPAATETAWSGGRTTLSVNASSPALDELSYQWYRDGVAIEGATAAAYTIYTVTAANAGTYAVKISNGRGTTTSNSVVLTVTSPDAPLVLQPLPPRSEAAIGGPVTFSVEIAANPPPTYQWFFNGNAILGANDAQYTIDHVTTANLGKYTVEAVSGPNTISPGETELFAVTAPVITTLPAEEVRIGVAGVGLPLTVEIENGGAELLAYQWFLDGEEIPDATEATHQALATGTYVVRVSNGAGSVSGEIAKVKIVGPPVVSAFTAIPQNPGAFKGSPLFDILDRLNNVRPADLTITARDPVKFEATVQGGDEPITYTWLLDGQPLAGTPNTAIYETADITRDSTYAVRVSNAAGEVTTWAVSIRVIQPPEIITHPVGFELKAGTGGTLNVVATGTGQLTYQWEKSTDGGATWANIPHAVLPTYTIATANTASGGFYRVVVGNTTGTKTYSKEVEVRVSSTNSVGTTGQGTQNSGSSISLASASSTSGGTVSTIIPITPIIPTATAAATVSATAAAPIKNGTFSLGTTAANSTAAAAGEAPAAAPAELVEGLRIILAGELADSATKEATPEDSVLEILAGKKLPNGSFSYERTGTKTGVLTYAITYGDPGNLRLETGVILLTFDTATGGTYVLSGEYNGLSAPATPAAASTATTGTLAGLGDFQVEK